MIQDRKKVSCWIPLETLRRLEDRGYTSQTEAILKGLECLLMDSMRETGEDHGILQARNEELERLVSVLQDQISKLNQDKEDLKNTYNNYFLQVQTLINQRALEEGGGKKRKWWFW